MSVRIMLTDTLRYAKRAPGVDRARGRHDAAAAGRASAGAGPGEKR